MPILSRASRMKPKDKHRKMRPHERENEYQVKSMQQAIAVRNELERKLADINKTIDSLKT